MTTDLEALAAHVIAGNREQVEQVIKAALAEGCPAEDLLSRGLIQGIDTVGRKMAARELFIPEVLRAARAMYGGLDLLRPIIAQDGGSRRGTVVLGTVKGDVHDIGKNLVAMMLDGAGYKIVNLGVDVTPTKFADAVGEHQADVVGMSAMLTTTMAGMRATVSLLDELGLRGGVKVLVGGAPTNASWAKEIGADGWGHDAAHAVELTRQLVS